VATLDPRLEVRAALYIRVSTVDQNPQMQFDELREFCRARGWKAAAEFVDHGVSGIDTSRPGLRQLLEACHQRSVDAVCVWRLDRLARSLAELVKLTKTFEALHVNFVSVRNPGLDTTTPTGKLFFGISAVFAEFERDLIIERTRAGVAAAVARGKKLGRPRIRLDVEHIRKLRAMGLSYRQIANSLRVSKTLICDILRDQRELSR
jgi:DNA invertase Pin-like site-specific DNA recombinase